MKIKKQLRHQQKLNQNHGNQLQVIQVQAQVPKA